ncbi:hypothetical protein DXG01_014973, partial [Tephrocybe rancida]
PEQFSTSTAFRASSFSSETAPQAQVSLMASPQPGNDLAANRPHSASTDLPVPNANADVDSGTIVDDPAPAGNSASGVAVIPEFEATTPTPAADMGPAASPDGAQSDPDSDLTPAPESEPEPPEETPHPAGREGLRPRPKPPGNASESGPGGAGANNSKSSSGKDDRKGERDKKDKRQTRQEG